MSETKNPFTKVEVGSTVQPPNGTGLALLKLFRRDGSTSMVLPATEAKYAAHAINQHDKLVAERDRLVEAGKAYQDLCTCYRIGKQPTAKLFNRLDDAKAALLAGETTP